jgi:uncharacterized protein
MPDKVAHDPSMLLAFRAENVRSFRDQLEFSMLASPLAEKRFTREIKWREGGQPLKVLPVAGVFGANASGKSNLLKAMDDMQTYVIQSFRRASPGGELPRWQFRLDPDASQRPSRYEIDLVLSGIRHEYGFTLDSHRILEEWAIRYPHGRASLLFHRDGDRVEVGSAERGQTRAVTKLLRTNALFLSTAASANHPLLLPLYEWFRRNLLLAEANSRPFRQAFTAALLNDDSTQSKVMALLRAADLGITSAKNHEIDPATRERLARAARIIMGEEDKPDSESDEALTFDGLHNVSLMHRSPAGEVELDPVDESLGTLIWLGLIGPVVDALRGGRVFLADELDASLHPALVARLVALFQDPRTNPRRAQLIFNSHDTTVLGGSGDNRLIGRDQIWFTEKLNDGSTRLYPLADMNPRKHEAVASRYLAGRYGATPILSHNQFATIGELISADD